MCEIKVIKNNNTKKVVILKAKKGDNLLNILVQNGVKINAPCGGNGKCGKCKVVLEKSDYKIKTDNDGSFLSCKHKISGNLTIKVNEFSGAGLTDFKIVESDSISNETGYGYVVDIGTTTVAGYLIDLATKKSLHVGSCLNPQISFGADVLSRINEWGKGNKDRLHNCICECVKNLIDTAKDKTGIKTIKKVYVSGNTTMLHIFANVDPTSIGVAPFNANFLDAKELCEKLIGQSGAKVLLMPSIASYVGSDITCGIIATSLDKSDKVSILVDIGTNGEMVLSRNGSMVACATAAGPCFEGANITCGVGGVSGAIDSVVIKDKKINFTTIGNQKPTGICGSGLVDIIGQMLECGLIDESGAFCNFNYFDGGIFDSERLVISDEIILTQADVRQFQLAKSAIRAGLEVMMNSCLIKANDVDALYIGGGLGFYLDIFNAVRCGLLPNKAIDIGKQVGNTSALGAINAIVDDTVLEYAKNVAKSVAIIDLPTNKLFNDLYIEHMFFE